MNRIPHAFALAIGQLGDRGIVRVLARSMGVTLLIVLAMGALAWRGAAMAIERQAAGWGELGGLAGLVLAVIGAWLLFRVVALAVLQFFADSVVRAVEARHYPDAAASGRDPGLGEDARHALAGLARALVVNAVALPIGLLLLVTGIGTALWFWAVNAWLLGRELQDMVWLRHRPAGAVAPPLSGLTRFALGGIVAGMLLVPFANLLAPVIGAAMATHLVHSRKVRV